MQFSQTLATAAVLALSSPLLNTSAFAQDATVHGPGYKVSEGTVVHPTVGTELGFVSNVFYEDSTPLSSPLFRLLGTLAFASADPANGSDEGDPDADAGAPPTFEFSAGLRMTYEEYLSSNANAQSQRNLGLGADVQLKFFPKRKVSFSINDNFIRTNQPTNFESSRLLSRDVNRLQAKVTIQSNESSIKTSFRFENTLDFFESDGASFANRQQSLLGGRIDWQFLPITRFYFDASWGINSAIGNGTSTSSTPLKLKLGVDTAITELTTIRVHAGFGKGFYSSGSDYTNAVYGAEFGYRYSPVGRVTLAYKHDYVDSINSNFYSDHGGELKVDQQIDRAILTAKAQVGIRFYEGVNMGIGGGPSRSDFILGLGVNAGYEMKEWLSLSADYLTQVITTDYISMVDGVSDDPSFTRHTFMVGATAAF